MRAWHAVAGKAHMSTEVDGEEVNTGPLHIFLQMLSKYVRQVNPSEVVVCWDGGRSAKRMAIYPGYKGERGEQWERDPVFLLAKEALTVLGVHHVEMPGVEADDLIAYYWRHRSPGHYDSPVCILSGDKDFLQLLDSATFQIRPGAGSTPEQEVWNEQRVITEMGCHPSTLSSVMALTGDKADCIPGIPRFGTKTAVKVLSDWDWSLDKALDLEDRLAGHEDEVRRNLALIDLRHGLTGLDLPQPPPFRPTDRTGVLYQDALEFMARYELAALRQRLADGTLWKDE